MNTSGEGPVGVPASAPWEPPATPPPAAWYPDPLNQQLRRYFDGTRWTYWTADPTRQPDQSAAASSAPVDGPFDSPAVGLIGDPVPVGAGPAGAGGQGALREDIANARAEAQALVGAGKEIRLLEQYLRPEERVVALSAAQGSGMGVLACTNQRLPFVFVGIVNRQFFEIDWNQARNVVYDVRTKVFAVYTGKVTKRAVPAFSVRVPARPDAERISRAAVAASAAPRLDIL